MQRFTNEQFEQVIQKQLAEAEAIRTPKNKDYADASEAFANFHDAAESMGVTAFQAFGIYLKKHTRAIDAFLKTGKLESEPIEARIADCINYMLILRGLIQEVRANESAQKRLDEQFQQIENTQRRMEQQLQDSYRNQWVRNDTGMHYK